MKDQVYEVWRLHDNSAWSCNTPERIKHEQLTGLMTGKWVKVTSFTAPTWDAAMVKYDCFFRSWHERGH